VVIVIKTSEATKHLKRGTQEGKSTEVNNCQEEMEGTRAVSDG